MRLGLLGLLAVIVVGPQIAVLFKALGNADTRALVAARPLVAMGLALAFTFWLVMFALPLQRLIANLNGRRSIVITTTSVEVLEENAAGARFWTVPLSHYEGITHRIRTSLSGARHELMLVHPEWDRSVLLMVAEHISETDITHYSRLLGVPQIAPHQGFMSVASAHAVPDRVLPASALAA
ncbi:MAG: hypothetical protein ABL907_21130 [Hyphomicrobium sp.]